MRGSKNVHDDQGNPQLPQEFVGKLTQPFKRFLKIEAAAGFVLLISVMIAMILSNSVLGEPVQKFWEIPIGIRVGSADFSRSLREWINDGLMTLFFFVIALELKRGFALGELRYPRKAALSIFAAIGGMLVPAMIYYLLLMGQPEQHGWGTVMATDTAFVIGCLALLGKRIPQSLRVFMLSLAVIDDIGAILVVAIGYGHGLNWGPLLLAAAGIAVLIAIASIGVRSITIYFLVGITIWIAIDCSGINATITGVILGLMTPTGNWVSDVRLHAIFDRVNAFPPGDHWSGDTEDRAALRMAETAAKETLSPVERLEMMLHPWVSLVVMPLFALANAGVSFSFLEFSNSLVFAIFVGLAIGKPIGVCLFAWLAVRMRIAIRPSDLNWSLIIGGGFLAGIGFTMSLFIANLAFLENVIATAKLGILSASIFSAFAGFILLRLESNRRQRLGS